MRGPMRLGIRAKVMVHCVVGQVLIKLHEKTFARACSANVVNPEDKVFREVCFEVINAGLEGVFVEGIVIPVVKCECA